MSDFSEADVVRDSAGKFAPNATSSSTVVLDRPSVLDKDGHEFNRLEGEERVAALRADLEDGIAELVDSGELQQYLDAAAANRAKQWTMNNRLMAAMQLARRQHPDEQMTWEHVFSAMSTMDCSTFKGWKDRGRSVNKGEVALLITAPNKRWITKTNAKGEEEKVQITTGFRSSPTFDVSQTDGEPVPQHPSKPFEGQVDAGTVESMKGRLAELGFSYEEREIAADPVKLTGTLAYVTKEPHPHMVVDPRLSDAQKAQAIAHELGHVECGHLDDDADDYAAHRGRMETEAEAFSYMVMRSRGATQSDASAFSPGYIAGWSKGDKATVTKALNTATTAFSRSYEATKWD